MNADACRTLNPQRNVWVDRTFIAGCIAVGTSWLLPNHYPPWRAFHSEALAAVGALAWMAAALLGTRRAAVTDAVVVVSGLAVVALLQGLLGLQRFFGDAVIASAYLSAFAGSIAAGYMSAGEKEHGLRSTAIAALFCVGAFLSALIAVMQWLGLYASLWLVDVPPNARFGANLAQPNQFATLLNFGLAFLGWLHRTRRLHGAIALLAAAPMLLALCGTQSRSGWLGAACIAVLGLAASRQARDARAMVAIVLLGAAFIVLAVYWNGLNQLLDLAGPSFGGDRTRAGTRPLHWAGLLEAVWMRPLTGFGWNQVAVAQYSVLLDAPASGEWIEHSHNLLLDLVLWNGLPVGLGAAMAIVGWFVRCHRAFVEPAAAWVMAGLVAITLHSLLEFPLEYAYFLMPVGWLVGWISLEAGLKARFRLARGIGGAALAAGVAVLLMVWVDYAKVEEDFRQVRFGQARIAGTLVQDAPPRLMLLTQLGALLQTARYVARPDMPAEQIEQLRDVAMRYGSTPVLYRFALASALNGRSDDARDALVRLCKTTPAETCTAFRNAWNAKPKDRSGVAPISFPSTPTLPPS